MQVMRETVPGISGKAGPEVETLPGGAKVFRSHGRRPEVFRGHGREAMVHAARPGVAGSGGRA